MTDPKGYLVLEDGHEFSGFLFGAAPDYSQDKGYGEAVFNTSMTGYQEILTDPSYFGQIICMTTPHIGNTGVNEEDVESAHPWCAGFVVEERSIRPSNWRSHGTIDDYLKKNGVPGLWGIDTRSVTRHLRSQGVVRALIVDETTKPRAREILSKLPAFEGRDLIREVTTPKPYTFPTKTVKHKIVALDFGIKLNMLRSLSALGCEVEVFPATATAEEIMARSPDGVFLSNGPGDPSAAPYAQKTVRDLLGQVPIFGVCMGHQILSLALGAKTYKMKFGHRGANQPVFCQRTGRVDITSQNHGYAVDAASLPVGVEVTHINLNDKSIEGILVTNRSASSVQYHPEACPGPHDSMHLFADFVSSLGSS